ncbi:hypothetical protein C8J55DRAFT_556257 [Lentinula edodes]|uniref:Uncharacterized protein n=1 Tax=Lentinula lateritia TaxID=40482 RepID=A0A9W9AYD8_9AGAR|nr:hypothetical protein C8J55DRAFT_556257 [Lentinula edodes]
MSGRRDIADITISGRPDVVGVGMSGQHQSPPELLAGAVSRSVFASPSGNRSGEPGASADFWLSTEDDSVEYPGYGQPASAPQAIRNLGGHSSLETAFRRGASKSETLVELKLSPDDSFVHPVPGEVVANDVSLSNMNLETLFPTVASTLGPPEMNIYPQLVEEGIDTAKNTKPSSNQALRSNLRLFPPPIFSRQGIAQSYKLFKGNPASIVSTVVNEETGEKRRMINRMRWKGYDPATIAFSDPTAPDKPPTNVGAVREQVDKNILRILRDVWGVDHFRELAGDVLNFGLAKEASVSYPAYANSVHLLTVADDVAVPRSRITLVGRPGLVDLGPTHDHVMFEYNSGLDTTLRPPTPHVKLWTHLNNYHHDHVMFEYNSGLDTTLRPPTPHLKLWTHLNNYQHDHVMFEYNSDLDTTLRSSTTSNSSCQTLDAPSHRWINGIVSFGLDISAMFCLIL